MDDQLLRGVSQQLPVLPAPRPYRCPGEEHAIPRSIHLARLAAYYPKCRECEHRHDTGQLPKSTVGRLEQTAVRIVQPSPFGPQGVRGEYLNHLTRQSAGRIAAAVADRIWESQPLVGRLHCDEDDGDTVPNARTHSRPSVIVGHDARPSSPDLCIGVSSALRRMGCDVVDVGRVTVPCHAFAVEHLQADAGLFVTGWGCPPQWTGLDFVGPRGLPWSLGEGDLVFLASQDVARQDADAPASRVESEIRNRDSASGTLADIERRFLDGVDRPTRQGSSQRYFDALVPYRANLLKHFRDVRPLRIVCATSDPVLQTTLRGVFDSLPCDLIPVANPAATIDALQPDQRLNRQIRAAVKDASAACGAAIAENGQGVCLFDERGRPVASSAVLLRVAQHLRGSRPLRILLGESCSDVSDGATREAHNVLRVAGTCEALASGLFDPDTGFTIEPGGRLWIKDAVPTCDAVLTVGLLLRVLSDLRQPLSACLAGA